MAKGNNIIVSGEPLGKKLDVIVIGTPKPGTLMTLDPTVEPVSEMHSFEVFTASDGNQRAIAVLLPDVSQGENETKAYVTGTIGTVYFPVAGETLNMLVQNIAGTGDAFAIGDLLIADTGTGQLIATTGTPESEPFQVLETVAAITADTLIHCMFTGY